VVRHAEALRDLLVGAAADEVTEHLPLSLAERTAGGKVEVVAVLDRNASAQIPAKQLEGRVRKEAVTSCRETDQARQVARPELALVDVASFPRDGPVHLRDRLRRVRNERPLARRPEHEGTKRQLLEAELLRELLTAVPMLAEYLRRFGVDADRADASLGLRRLHLPRRRALAVATEVRDRSLDRELRRIAVGELGRLDSKEVRLVLC
jgi:hypothetical protein